MVNNFEIGKTVKQKVENVKTVKNLRMLKQSK